MNDESQPQDAQPPSTKRGEAAWKETKDRIAERNAQARKAGKQRREAHERQQAEVRLAAEQRRMAELLGKRRAT
jgi:uncharacterized protein involved in type VI secretion and phage assembly